VHRLRLLKSVFCDEACVLCGEDGTNRLELVRCCMTYAHPLCRCKHKLPTATGSSSVGCVLVAKKEVTDYTYYGTGHGHGDLVIMEDDFRVFLSLAWFLQTSARIVPQITPMTCLSIK
jgi:hypothetical protein